MRGRNPIALFSLTACLVACTASPEHQSRAPDDDTGSVPTIPAAGLRSYTNPTTALRFDLPTRLRVEHRRFDATTAAHKVKERFEVEEDGRLVTRIDVWTNAARLPVDAWVQTYAGYLKRNNPRVEARKVGRRQVPAVVFDTPASDQAPNVITAVSALEDRIVVVICPDGRDRSARKVFDLALASIAVEVQR